MSQTRIPGLKAAHIFSTPECQKRGGAELEEAIQRIRDAYANALKRYADHRIQAHFVLTIERLDTEGE